MNKSLNRQQMWRKQNPRKYRAHLDVQSALRRGDLFKQPCEVCGKERVDAHHPDYRHPLDVRWLCRKHHVQLHKEEARANG